MKLGMSLKLSREGIEQKIKEPLERGWLSLPSHCASKWFPLRVMSYNLLAPCYVFHKFFPFTNKSHLEWSTRSFKIKQEIAALNFPHLISFQEYQKTLGDGIKAFLSNQGYKHHIGFKQNKKDGVCIFYKADNLQVEWEGYLDLNLGRQIKELSSLNFDTCAVFCLLQAKAHPGHYFLVVNTHLLYAPHKGVEKLAELIVIIKAIHTIQQAFKDKCEHIHLIFNGDFNFLPASPLYNLMTDGVFNPYEFSEKNYSRQLFSQWLHNEKHSQQSHFLHSTHKWCLSPLKNNIIENKQKQILQYICNIEVYLEQNHLRMAINPTTPSIVHYASHLVTISYTFQSAYSTFYKQYAQLYPFNSLSNVDKYINQHQPLDNNNNKQIQIHNQEYQNKLDKQNLTFEYSQTQLASTFRATVDYIWYQSELMRPTSIYQAIDYNNQYFPNQEYPSDHMSLCTDFQIQLEKKQ